MSVNRHWRIARLDDVCDVILGQSPPGDTYNANGKGLPFYQGKAEFGDLYPVVRKWCSSPSKVAEKDDVLISVRAPVGPTNLCPEKSCIGRGLAAIRPRDGMPAKYLLYAIRATSAALTAKGTGSTFEAVSGSEVRAHCISVAPPDEQPLIVDEIDKQFSRLDAGVAALKRVQANLKRYRAAVLKAACEGRLVNTEAELARQEGRTYETGEQLLERILVERREKWNGRGKYKEPAKPDISGLPELPEGWVWSTAGQLCECIVPNRDKPKTFSGEIPWVTLPDFSDSIGIHESISRMGLTKDEVSRYKARLIPAGSVIMSCIGRFGLSAVLQADAVVNQQLHAFLVPSCLFAKYLAYVLRTQKSFMEATSTSTTIAYMNKDNCNSVPVALPPLNEQWRIVAEIERHLSVVDDVEATVVTNMKRAGRLWQAVLQREFGNHAE